MSLAWPVAEAAGHTLPAGTRVGEVEITGLIGEGGFGIVYLAHDPSLQRRVAVKEYMPSSLASRGADGLTVSVKSERHRETFEAGRRSFVNEARLLARFDHPALVKVYRFWEAHGTAYMMMPFYEGPTLALALARLGHAPDEATLRGWLQPLLAALEQIHAASCFHRDISPDNIILGENGPLLLDFGAARRVIGDMTQALTVVLKPGYAPIEQYGESARMLQGAWTDLYALGCVVHYAITGRAPMTSVERLMDDALAPLSRVAAGRYSPAFLRAIDAVLAVRPQHRPQDVAQFRALLGAGDDHAATPVATPPRVEFADLPLSMPVVSTGPATRRRSGAVVAGLVAAAVAAGLGAVALQRSVRPTARPVAPSIGAASAAVVHDPARVVTPPTTSGTRAAPSPVAMSMPTLSKSPVALPSRGAPPLTHPAASRPAASRPEVVQSTPVLPARCSELLQKASLEALNADETAFLRQACR